MSSNPHRLLIIFCLICLFCCYSASAIDIDNTWSETEIITQTGECKNDMGIGVAECILKVWFSYKQGEYPIPHVVECKTIDKSDCRDCNAKSENIDYPKKTIRVNSYHTAQAHPSLTVLSVEIIKVDCKERKCQLWIECDQNGKTRGGTS